MKAALCSEFRKKAHLSAKSEKLGISGEQTEVKLLFYQRGLNPKTDKLKSLRIGNIPMDMIQLLQKQFDATNDFSENNENSKEDLEHFLLE